MSIFSNKKPFFLTVILFFIVVLSYGQNRKTTDSLYNNRVVIAETKAEGLNKLLSLSKDQKQQVKLVEIDYQERIQQFRNIGVASRDVSTAIKQTQDWRMEQLQKILTPQQWTSYRARQQQIDNKINSKPFAKKGNPVVLKRK